MIYKIGVVGASGRVGSEICAMTREGYRVGKDCLELADVVVRSERLSHVEAVSTRKFGEPAREPVHVWVDFSRPEATLQLLKEAQCGVVIGTTGFSEAQMSKVREFSNTLPVLLSPNMSIGMNLMMRCLRLIPGQAGFSAVLLEEHHRHKKDSPSGTAKRLLEILQGQGYAEVPVHVTRAGGIRGTHSVKLISDAEVLEIRHEVTDRKVFAEGALRAALFIAKQQKPGFYGMDDVFVEGR